MPFIAAIPAVLGAVGGAVGGAATAVGGAVAAGASAVGGAVASGATAVAGAAGWGTGFVGGLLQGTGAGMMGVAPAGGMAGVGQGLVGAMGIANVLSPLSRLFGSSDMPSPQSQQAAQQARPTYQTAVDTAEADERRRRLGRTRTLLTSGQGALDEISTTGKTLMGE